MSSKGVSEAYINGLIAVFVAFGTMSTMTSKILFQYEGTGLNDQKHKFEKPLFQATMMFVGMALCMIVYWATKPKVSRETVPLLNSNVSPAPAAKTDWRVYYVVAVPAVCDFLATYMMTIGLLWVNASIYQMVRGSIVLFSAFIRWSLLGKKIYNFQWAGVIIVMFGELLVGYSALAAHEDPSLSLSPSSSPFLSADNSGSGSGSSTFAPSAHATTASAVATTAAAAVTSLFDISGYSSTDLLKLLGIALVFLAQLVQALQVVVEEHLLHDVSASAYLVVGLEGVWGLLLCMFISMPLAYYIQTPGIHEDMLDTLSMMQHNPWPLIPVTVAYTLTILGFNLTAMKITEHINSVTRCVLDTARTIFIWILMTLAHYYVDPAYGEAWTPWCFLELIGFATLMVGLFIYYQVFTMPSIFEYPTETAALADPVLATPLLTPMQRRKASTGTPYRNDTTKYGTGPSNLVSVSVGSIGISGSLNGQIERNRERETRKKQGTPVGVSSPRI